MNDVLDVHGRDGRQTTTMRARACADSSLSSISYTSSFVALGDGFDEAFEDDDDDVVEPPRILSRTHSRQQRQQHRCDAEVLVEIAWQMAIRTIVTEEGTSSVSSLEEIFERVDTATETLALQALGRRLGRAEEPPLHLVSPERDGEQSIRRRRDAILDANDAKELTRESLAFGDIEEARERMLGCRSLSEKAELARAFALLAATTFGTNKVVVAKRRDETIHVKSTSFVDELETYTNNRKRQRREALRELTTQSAEEQPDVRATTGHRRVTEKSPLGSPKRASTWRDTAVKIAVTERKGQENESPRGV